MSQTERIMRDLVFDQDSALTLDLYRAEDAERCPTVLYVHGDLVPGGTADRVGRMRTLSAAGISVAAVNLRAAEGFATPVRDVRTAAGFLAVNAKRLGIGRRLGVIGVSLGGYVAGMAALGGAGDGARIGAVSPWSAPSDLWLSSRRSGLERRIGGVPLFESALVPALEADALRAASPVHQPLAAAPPFLILHGDHDVVVPPSQSQLLHDALRQAGRETALLTLGGAGHDDDRFDDGALLSMVAGWFRAVLTVEGAVVA